MSAKSENAAARTSNIAEQQLQDRRRANDLHTRGVLRPAHGVTDSACLVRSGSCRKRLGDFQEDMLRHATLLFDQFRRVAREVLLQDLENTARMQQRRVRLVDVRVSRLATAILRVSAGS